MSNALSLRSIESSNLPSGQKSAIRRFLEHNVGSMRAVGSIRGHAVHTAHALRAGGESVLAGALAGLAHASLKHGLDTDAKGQVPLDGIVGGLLLLGAGYAGGFTDGAHDMRNFGSTLLGIATFRNSFKWVAARRKAKGLPVGAISGEIDEGMGDMGAEDEDEIVAAARRLARR